jgi:hypothetical protein
MREVLLYSEAQVKEQIDDALAERYDQEMDDGEEFTAPTPSEKAELALLRRIEAEVRKAEHPHEGTAFSGAEVSYLLTRLDRLRGGEGDDA